MRRYELRANCEYVLIVDAVDPAAALAQGDAVPWAKWDQSWSETELSVMKEELNGARQAAGDPGEPGRAGSGAGP